ncbi:MAG: CoA-binding protein [Deltaproteobacteria bacterium]|nr:CoA-binding protein [Deltaproteobacteria bacterium]
MPSAHESFWTYQRYAVVGHTARKPFPALTYEGLKEQGKTAFAVDPSATDVAGDKTYAELAQLPEPVDAIVIEVPRDETARWVERAADAGIKHVWIHMKCDTPEAHHLAQTRGLDLHSGTCAVMYLKGGFHKIHKWINKAIGKY